MGIGFGFGYVYDCLPNVILWYGMIWANGQMVIRIEMKIYTEMASNTEHITTTTKNEKDEKKKKRIKIQVIPANRRSIKGSISPSLSTNVDYGRSTVFTFNSVFVFYKPFTGSN